MRQQTSRSVKPSDGGYPQTCCSITIHEPLGNIQHRMLNLPRRGECLPALNPNGIRAFSPRWGRSTDAEVAPYCATKWAVEGLTQSLAQELPAGLATVALNPGIINTDMLRGTFGGSASSYPTAEEWAKKAVPFLLRLGARENGQPLTVG